MPNNFQLHRRDARGVDKGRLLRFHLFLFTEILMNQVLQPVYRNFAFSAIIVKGDFPIGFSVSLSG